MLLSKPIRKWESNMTLLLSRKDIATQKFHRDYNADLRRYAIFVKGNGEYQHPVLFQLDGVEDSDEMLEWLHQHKVLKQTADDYANSDDKLRSLASTPEVDVSVVDHVALVNGDDYYLLHAESLDGHVKHHLDKIAQGEI